MDRTVPDAHACFGHVAQQMRNTYRDGLDFDLSPAHGDARREKTRRRGGRGKRRRRRRAFRVCILFSTPRTGAGSNRCKRRSRDLRSITPPDNLRIPAILIHGIRGIPRVRRLPYPTIMRRNRPSCAGCNSPVPASKIHSPSRVSHRCHCLVVRSVHTNVGAIG